VPFEIESSYSLFTLILLLVVGLGQAQEPVTVHVLTMQQADMTVDEMQTISDEFMAANPGINVAIEFVSYEALYDKFTTSLATDPAPYEMVKVWPRNLLGHSIQSSQLTTS
jgi:ABC-type glycerol-3-phosphate transport system substrate-binding protein